MFAEERHQEVLRRARENGRVDVASLAAELDVTPETVRRDLSALEDFVKAVINYWKWCEKPPLSVLR